MMKRGFAFEALVNYPRLIFIFNSTKRADEAMVSAFAAMNTFNALITPPEKHHIFCLWDHEQQDANPLTFEDDRFLKQWLNKQQYRTPPFSNAGKDVAYSSTHTAGQELDRYVLQ
jgi:hypothetical protein